MTENTKNQFEKFKQAARELETDDDEARFDERMKKLVKAPVPLVRDNVPARRKGR